MLSRNIHSKPIPPLLERGRITSTRRIRETRSSGCTNIREIERRRRNVKKIKIGTGTCIAHRNPSTRNVIIQFLTISINNILADLKILITITVFWVKYQKRKRTFFKNV